MRIFFNLSFSILNKRQFFLLRTRNFNLVYKFRIYKLKLKVLNVYSSVSYDYYIMNSIIQVLNTKSYFYLIYRLLRKVTLVFDDNLDKEKSLDCFVKVDVLALLKSIFEIDES